MNTEYYKNKITNQIEIRKYLTTYCLVLSSGLVGLFLTDMTFMKLLLFISGAILDAILFMSIAKHNQEITKLIEELNQ